MGDIEGRQTSDQRQLVPPLTSLRFAAAAYVVVFHYYPRGGIGATWYEHLINHGYVGVSFFFVLSGFILGYNNTSTDFSHPKQRRVFYMRRIARIYPAFAAATALHWPLFAYYLYSVLSTEAFVLRTVVVSALTFTLVQAWVPSSLGQLNAPGWTISVEMFLYATFPRIVSKTRGMNLAAIALWFVGAFVACWIPAIIAPQVDHLFPSNDAMPTWLRSPFPLAVTWITCSPILHVPQFFIGVLCGTCSTRPGPLSSRLAMPAAALSLLSCVWALGFPRGASATFDLALNHGALAPCFGLLFWAIATGSSYNARWLRPLSFKPLVVLGEASYALYIFQMPVMELTKHLSKVGVPASLIFAAGFCVLICVSLVSWRFEQKVRPILLRRLLKWRSRDEQLMLALEVPNAGSGGRQ